jgi:hypothetical protein
MTTQELNQYLRAHVKCSQGDFLSGKTIGGRYASFRNDAHIYCWSGMNSVINQVTNNINYSSWMQRCARQMAQLETLSVNEQRILQRAIQCVKDDGDDLCDEQSVGWYLAVYTYMHCLAYGTYNYETLFLKYWRMYFTEEYQQAIR